MDDRGLVGGGIPACVWLVRLQWLLARSGRLTKVVPDAGLWVMWALPFVSWVLPAVRISRLERATFGTGVLGRLRLGRTLRSPDHAATVGAQL
ncbi:hypothetical protein GCM10009868_34990 [Terrabacter aerolatus]|uniref:DUF4328 domain-containing protein n=1 Tax=Terrabacter aerolatus TaxID=422442 RepID=A0A512CWD7_9MICO|nr:hypothetical protein TAE01_03260 [Terrabacter aerolatus]